MLQRRIMFLTLTTFSSTGGIEKFNRSFLKAMMQLQSVLSLNVYGAGMYDNTSNEYYISQKKFKPFFGKRLHFIFRNIIYFFSTDILIVGHLNLAIMGTVFKLLFPAKRLILICHGIEVFDKVSPLQQKMLKLADDVLCVSNYTKEQLIKKQKVSEGKITVFPNTIDPCFLLPQQFNKPEYLAKRYGIAKTDKVLFTLTRLSHAEGYKGYDKVLHVLPALVKKGIQFKYILAGKADAKERAQVEQLICQLQLHEHVILTGFVADEEIADHYLLSDVFVMPSKGEGFGIVYLEAMACGLPVIAGNKDGSTEALQFGKLGTLVDPDDAQAIEAAIAAALEMKNNPLQVQQQMLEYFSFDRFEKRLQNVLQERKFAEA